jgi:hypothetical protein
MTARPKGADGDHDRGVAAFLDRLPRQMTYTQMAAACLERFGADGAWSRTKIAEYWKSRHPRGVGRVSRIDLDPELRDFVEDRLGRLTLDELAEACGERFGPERSPSWSAIQRYAQRRRSCNRTQE